MNNPLAEIQFIASPGAMAACAVMGPATLQESVISVIMPANVPGPRLRVVSPRDTDGESASADGATSSSARALFESSLPIIAGVVRFVCHRHRLDPEESKEFESEVMLWLVDRDYKIIGRFQHRSSLRTYLVVVIQRLFLDYRNHLWGKWRSSAEAIRLGPVAVRLERLLAREGYDFDQACETLRTNEGVTLSRAELADIAARFPIRTRRSVVGEEALETVAESGGSPDAGALAADPSAIGMQIRRALAPAVQALADQDRLILRLRFQDGLGVADIARALHLEQRPLYRRFESLLRGLRDALEAAGIDRDAAREAVSRKDVDISLALLGEAPAADRQPSDRV